jgi:hypothetical protein
MKDTIKMLRQGFYYMLAVVIILAGTIWRFTAGLALRLLVDLITLMMDFIDDSLARAFGWCKRNGEF